MSKTWTDWRLSLTPETLIVYLIGTGISVYVWLGLGSLLGSIGLLFLGVCLGMATVLLTLVFSAPSCVLIHHNSLMVHLVVTFFLITKTSAGGCAPLQARLYTNLQDTFPEQDGVSSAEQKRQECDDVVREMLQGTKLPAPPHPFLHNGRYRGWVWTIPSSKYVKTDPILNWPPASEGPKAVATKWWASLRGRTLYLARSSNLQETYQVPVSEVKLDDCKVEVLLEALKSKSRWWRKCPIQISHSSRELLNAESSFAMFAEGSAAKEQWYKSLKQASGETQAVQAVEDAYLHFCRIAKDVKGDAYSLQADEDGNEQPKQHNTDDGLDLDVAVKPKTTGNQSRKWGRLFTRRRTTPVGEADVKRGMKSSSSIQAKKKTAQPGL